VVEAVVVVEPAEAAEATDAEEALIDAADIEA
jgi:hypothetical protein